MLDNEPGGLPELPAPGAAESSDTAETTTPARRARRRPTKATAASADPDGAVAEPTAADSPGQPAEPGADAPVKAVRRRRKAASPAEAGASTLNPTEQAELPLDPAGAAEPATSVAGDPTGSAAEPPAPATRTRRRSGTAAARAAAGDEIPTTQPTGAQASDAPTAVGQASGDDATGTAASAGRATEPSPTIEFAAEDAPAPRRRAAAGRSARRAPVASADSEPASSEQSGSDQPGLNQPGSDQVGSDSAETDSAEQPKTRSRRRAAPPTVLFIPPAEQVAQERAAARAQRPAEPAPAVDAQVRDSQTRQGHGWEPVAELGTAPQQDQADDAAGRAPARRRRGRRTAEEAEAPAELEPTAAATDADLADEDDEDDDDETAAARRRRRRGRRGRGRGRGPNGEELDESAEAEDEVGAEAEAEEPVDDEDAGDEALTRRRRRRRRKGAADTEGAPEEPHVVVKIREPRATPVRDRDEVQGVSGSTRLEAKRQRRRDGREQRRTRPPILSESEFLARREAVDRVMVVRQKNDRTQIGVLEDGVLVEHYVTRQSAATMVGNVYLGRVQNVLPSMEAAFVDIGRGRNAVLYAGEVNWDASGLEGRTRTIEQALRSGDSVLVQVTKDPIGTKGARLSSHIALSGRHLVYVPHGNASGISRKLSDIERKRLRDVLKHLVPDGAGVIVRTAAEGASEDDLARDVTRLQAQWEDIQRNASAGHAPELLYSEPDLVIRVVRDLFNEDFRELIIQGAESYDMVEPYLAHVSPDLVDRLHRYTGVGDVFTEMRIDEQIIKALDRKVFLPSGGSLVIDRTEAMTVIDVNTGKYTGVGGNLEETVTRNNLEAAEEIVRQLRLRDLGGIIVIDFIDMVLESNRDLVLRRLTECLGRDRTKHQVTEITSLGLVQMTRKRVGQGLLEAFSEPCEVCKGRGLIVHTDPVPEKRTGNDRAAVAKVAAASASANGNGNGNAAAGGTGGGNGAQGDAETPRASRRRGRRSSAATTADDVEPLAGEDPVDDELLDGNRVRAGVIGDDAIMGVHEPVEYVDSDGAVAVVGSDSDDVIDDDLEEAGSVGGRRRSRRGGARRRTRP